MEDETTAAEDRPATAEEHEAGDAEDASTSTTYDKELQGKGIKRKRIFDKDIGIFEDSNITFRTVLSMSDLGEEQDDAEVTELDSEEANVQKDEEKEASDEETLENQDSPDEQPEQEAWNCEVCNFSYDSLMDLQVHILDNHHEDFTCSACKLLFLHKEKLQCHLCEADFEPGTFLCMKCGKSFNKKALLEAHQACHEQGAYYCETCHSCFPNKNKMADHACYKENGEPFQCDICDKKLKNELYLIRHLAQHDQKHACLSCSKEFATEKQLVSHVIICQGLNSLRDNQAVQCHTCLQIFTDAKLFVQHAATHSHPYACEKCRTRFSKPLSLMLHACFKRQNGSVMCNECGRVFEDQRKLEHHLQVHEKVQFECEYCQRMFVRKDLLLRHACAVNRDEKRVHRIQGREYLVEPRICETCGMSFTSKSALGIHTKIHGEKMHECEICGKRFHRSDTLKIHYSVHTDVKNFQCGQCGRQLKSKAALRVHLVSHTGAKPFACDICDQRFAQKANMEKHRDTHDPNRCYKCDFCDKSFADKMYAKVHQLEHTATTRFGCKICHKTFVKMHLLNNHLREAHTSETYLCQFCGMAIKMKHSLKRHMLRKHSDMKHIWEQLGYFKSQQRADIDDGNSDGAQSTSTLVRVDSEPSAAETVTITDEAGNLIETGFEQILLLSNLATEDGTAISINPEQMEAIGEALQAVESLEHSSDSNTMESRTEMIVPLVNNSQVEGKPLEREEGSVLPNETDVVTQVSDEKYVEPVSTASTISGNEIDTVGALATVSTTLSININGIQTTAVIPVENPTPEQIQEVVQRIMQLPQVKQGVGDPDTVLTFEISKQEF